MIEAMITFQTILYPQSKDSAIFSLNALVLTVLINISVELLSCRIVDYMES